ncbi:MAG: DUF2157 domain-containing protein [Rhizobacter sp.]|nr:DUF2157 domain-containing protein [Ferruginibacter sp.]
MSKHILKELPELVKAGVITDDISDKIENFYRQKQRAQPDGRINTLFAIIGTILVSLGIILIVAHNWDQFSRPVKLFFSFMPLVIGQALCGYTLYTKMDNTGFRESSATFLFFAFGACLSLVSQLYHISGTIQELIFTWMLVSFPLIYIMRSSMVSLLYICGITVYAMYDSYGYNTKEWHHYWWMLLLALPHYRLLFKNRPQGNFTYFHHWFIPLTLTICLPTIGSHVSELIFIAYMSMFSAFYLLGTSATFYNKRIFSNGYIVIGSLGTVILLLLASFRFFWDEFKDLRQYVSGKHNFSSVPETIAAAVWFFIASILLINHLRRRESKPVNFMGFIYVVFAAIFIIGIANPSTAAIIVNILVLGVAVFIIARGNYLDHLGILNYGLLVITALVICRFFDTNISFVIRGVMFIGVGAGFFIANSRLIKKRKSYNEK